MKWNIDMVGIIITLSDMGPMPTHKHPFIRYALESLASGGYLTMGRNIRLTRKGKDILPLCEFIYDKTTDKGPTDKGPHGWVNVEGFAANG